MELKQAEYIHMIGIGGAGMCGLAEILAYKGYRVSGSDLSANAMTARLESLEITVYQGHQAEQLPENTDLVVISSAIPESNPELVAARAAGKTVIKRGELLAQLMNPEKGIAVAGAHGKTTTTAMIYQILAEAGLEPSFIVGGQLQENALNVKLGGGEYFVTEADESDGSFLALYPLLAIVTNIEDDHLDYYHTVENIRRAFLQFINQVSNGGKAILYEGDEYLRALRDDIRVPAVFYGEDKNADYYIDKWQVKDGGSRFEVFAGKDYLGELELKVPGRHNALNALAATVATLSLGVEFAQIRAGLQKFGGTKRRFQFQGNVEGVTVIDDYAHHPTEIKATLRAAREIHEGRIIAVFQPHRYTRTRQLFREFGESFADADEVLVSGIYSAGEKPLPGISGRLIADGIALQGGKVDYLEDKKDLADFIKKRVQAGDMVITMGAGDIWQSGIELLKILTNKQHA